jgi:acetyltransferase-like isoleucine patch superfamily enzyme
LRIQIKSIVLEIVASAVRNIGGTLGIRIRRAIYRACLRECGLRLVIETGVSLISPEWISLGDDVWIDKNAVIIAGPSNHHKRTKIYPNVLCKVEPGRICIGSGSHVGLGTIVQGHGGVQIGKNFTSSPYCTIFSQSNDYRTCRAGTMEVNGKEVFYLQTPVRIGDNVWLGVNVSVFGHSIGADTFIMPGSIVCNDVPCNTVAGGFPATATRERFPESARI